MQDFYVQNGLFDRKHLLRLQPETIEFEANDSIDNLFIQCRKVEVKAFKYYDERLQFDMFRVGTKFKISIQRTQSMILKMMTMMVISVWASTLTESPNFEPTSKFCF